MTTIDLMDRFGNLGEGGIRNNGTLDAEAMFQPSLRTMRTDFIQVKAGDSIVYKNMSGMSSIWNILSFYTGDAQGFYVSGIAGQTTPQSGVWTAQQDGYVRLFGSFPAGDNISVTMTDLAPDVEDYLAKYNSMNYRFLPNSIPKIVAHIQEYLSNHPIADSTTLQAVIDAAFESYLEDIHETADTYIAEAVPPAAAAAVDAAASPALQEITAKAAEAAESAREAALSEQSAEMSEENALTYRNQAQQIKDSITAEVAASVQAAQEQATLAQESAQAADESADTAEQYVAQARAQAEAAAAQAQTASGYASDAQGYMQDASGFAQNASDFADNAAQSAATFTTDPTLTISGKAADAKATGDQLSDLKSQTTIISGVQTMVFEDGYIDIPKVGSEASVSRVSYANRKSAVSQISEGQLININVIGVGTSSAGGRAWAFLDDNHIVLSRADSQLTVHDILVAPANSAYIVLNTRTDTISDYYGYIGMIDQSRVLTTADRNAKIAVQQLSSFSEKVEIDLSTLEVANFWIDTANNIIDASIAVPARLVIVPVEENESVYVNIPLASTKRIAFCNSVANGSRAYSAQEISGSLIGTFKNSNYKYFVIQLFINSDVDKDYTHYLQNAEIAIITAVDFVARDEIKNLKDNGLSEMFVEENLKGLPILDSFNDITIVTSAYDNCSAFHALVKSELCDNSDGYLVQTLLGNDGHGNSLYKYVTNPYELRYNASREFGTPSYPITGGRVAPIYTVIVTTNIHGVEHGSNWVMYNLLKKLQNPDTDMLRFFKNNVRFVWIPYICASGDYENADGININRDFPTTVSGTCSSAEGTLVKSVLDEYGPVANLHIDIHTFRTTGTYAKYFATWTFTDSDKLGKRSVKVSKSVVDRYSAKYPSIDILTREVVSAINTPTTCTYYTQTVYSVPAGTIEGALQMDGSPSGTDEHTSATAYLYDIITQVICAMAS